MKKIIKSSFLGIYLSFCLFSSAQAATIVVQGNMQSEIQFLADQLTEAKVANVGPFLFYEGKVNNHTIVVSQTMIGAANAAVATYIAIDKYHPDLVINQGMAGGYINNLNVYDIVIADKVANLGVLRTPARGKGKGSDALEWRPYSLPEVDTVNPMKVLTDENALRTALSVKNTYKRGQVIQGAIGSTDIVNNEYDRISMLNQRYGVVAADTEAFAAAGMCRSFNVPVLVVKVISHNTINNSGFQSGSGVSCQAYVLNIIKAYMK